MPNLGSLKEQIEEGVVPTHWQGFAEEMDGRGWTSGDRISPSAIRNTQEHRSKLPITANDLNTLMSLLLDLGVDDQDSRISGLYFYLVTRLSGIDGSHFLYLEKAEDLYNILASSASSEETNLNKSLPCKESVYQNVALLLGNLALADSEVDDNTIPETFLYLQRRARNCNCFKLDGKIDKIESDVIRMMEAKTASFGNTK